MASSAWEWKSMDGTHSMKMTAETVREGSEDVHVRKYIAYGNVSDSKLYYDESYTTQVTLEDAMYAFERGMLLIKESTSGPLKTPVSITKDGYVVTLSEKTVTGSGSDSYVVAISDNWSTATGEGE